MNVHICNRLFILFAPCLSYTLSNFSCQKQPLHSDKFGLANSSLAVISAYRMDFALVLKKIHKHIKAVECRSCTVLKYLWSQHQILGEMFCVTNCIQRLYQLVNDVQLLLVLFPRVIHRTISPDGIKIPLDITLMMEGELELIWLFRDAHILIAPLLFINNKVQSQKLLKLLLHVIGFIYGNQLLSLLHVLATMQCFVSICLSIYLCLQTLRNYWSEIDVTW